MTEHSLPVGLTDKIGAQAVARRIWDAYDRDRDGIIDQVEVVPMIVDAMRPINRNYNPSRADIDAYIKVVDVNRDGKITYEDVEMLSLKYLVPDSVLTSSSTTVIYEQVIKKNI